jgi:hypothetical protein
MYRISWFRVTLICKITWDFLLKSKHLISHQDCKIVWITAPLEVGYVHSSYWHGESDPSPMGGLKQEAIYWSWGFMDLAMACAISRKWIKKTNRKGQHWKALCWPNEVSSVCRSKKKGTLPSVEDGRPIKKDNFGKRHLRGGGRQQYAC